MRTCGTCEASKELSCFAKNPMAAGGIRRQCKECDYQAQRRWVLANTDKTRAGAARYKAAHPERIRDLARKYRQADPEKWRAKYRRQYANNAVKRAAAAQKRRDRDRAGYNQMVCARRKANPDIMQAIHGNRKIREGSGVVTRQDIKAQLRYQGARCYYCHCDISERNEVDHFIALAAGGKHEPSNIVMACRRCNRSKNKFDAFDYFRKIGVQVEPLRVAA